MISIIICSINTANLSDIKKNISDTIGIEYEIIAVDNRVESKGICEVYNFAARESKFDILCFMHEDIKMHSENWGSKVLSIFRQNTNAGVVGVAGSTYKSLTPSSWHCYDIDASEALNYNIIQNYKYSQKERVLEFSNPRQADLERVVCLDGVWLCCTKSAFNFYQFDEKLLNAFHGYDLDFCLGVGQKYSVFVTFDILIEHFSEGNFNKIWLKEILKVHQKWSSKLPVNLIGLRDEKIAVEEKRGFKNLLIRMHKEKFSAMEMLMVIVNARKSKIMTFKLYVKLLNFWLKVIFRGH
ncbi:glycosyltransferase [Pedobacter alluvionis]|uniref:Glycosyl transferase family 2 n=1 Tax=Pedobacter alluvionis TaxID=475253 RepID=A0A497Y492_9SPHI|nr:glycosyltransferase [Pedobacter alluvionis]RLJ77691.1 glycosyl transferase family 2 [Pedobacter alluvionis]TFB33107.1 hypothetical protein E3V97_03430 [Pedobacter alluvionis]